MTSTSNGTGRYGGGHFKPLFSPSEYAGRVQQTKKEMSKRCIDLLMCCDPSNMNWLTGYDGLSYYVPQCVVVAKDLDEPLWIGRPMDAGGAMKCTYLAPENILSWPETSIHRPDDHPMQHVMKLLRERGLLARGQMGCELDHDYFTARAYKEIMVSLEQHGDSIQLVDASMLVNWLRLVKSDAELEMMRRAAKIADKSMAKALETTAVGMRQCDVMGAAIEAAICGTEDAGELAALGYMMPTGSDATAAHLTYTSETLQAGRGTFFELSGNCRRYHCPIARTIFLGTPPPKFKMVEEVVGESMVAALEAAKEGSTAEDVWNAFYGVLNGKHGYTKSSRLGYPVGIGYPPDWGEHTASIRLGDKTILRKNMCWHLIAGMWMDDWGYELSEVIIIRGNGEPPECLHQTERKLFVKDGSEPAAKKLRTEEV